MGVRTGEWMGGSICKFWGKTSIHLIIIREWPKITSPPLQEILIISPAVHFIRPLPNPTPFRPAPTVLQLCTKDSLEFWKILSLKMGNILKIVKCGQISALNDTQNRNVSVEFLVQLFFGTSNSRSRYFLPNYLYIIYQILHSFSSKIC